ncbi:3D domain-containing protein [Bacillus phage vB_BanS_MrDarsey]|uniref:3D domain-containing protein n=1 Tax=Bacillus phage vB_BanS_MrDarsey TaxID=2894787 RepID=A0AAE8YPJ5_9CAUD|nr:3D domain-containing protein [Bacillus phage vB_BanS_MrDarsey]UGO47903.1 3D domain-containing protein [Bacillus phage vB_BanS_MrDarsey]
MNKKFIISGVMTVNLMLTIGLGAYSYSTIDRKNAEISDNEKIIKKINDDNADKDNRIKDIQVKLGELDNKIKESEKVNAEKDTTINEQSKKLEEQHSQIETYQSKVEQLEKELNFKKQKKGSDAKKETNIEQPKQEVKEEKKSGRTITVEATAYTNHPSENGTYGGKVVTRTGLDISSSITYNGMGIIAVDPSVIPLNSIVQIEGLGTYIALDTGSAIQGNRIDILMADSTQTDNWGRRNVSVTIIN